MVTAIAAVIAAFAVFGPDDVPVAARRPAAAAGLTNAVGDLVVGATPPVPYVATCPGLRGVEIAGEVVDQAVLRRGLAALCNVTLPPEAVTALERFAAAGGVVRFAQFEATGVDSTGQLPTATSPPRILLNAKFTRTTPLWLAPLIAHDAVLLAGSPGAAEAALAARRVEAAVCQDVLGNQRPSRGCTDAAALLALPDPLGELRAAGYC